MCGRYRRLRVRQGTTGVGFLGELVGACERCCFFEEVNEGGDALFCAEKGNQHSNILSLSMRPLPTFTLPLPPNGPPSGYNRSMWIRSLSFDTGLDNRDRFLGERRCVVCGSGFGLKRCHIILQPEKAIVSRKVNSASLRSNRIHSGPISRIATGYLPA